MLEKVSLMSNQQGYFFNFNFSTKKHKILQKKRRDVRVFVQPTLDNVSNL